MANNNNTTSGPMSKYKVVFLGDQSVGKTSIINRFIFDNFTGNEQPTVGIDFISKNLQINNKSVRLQLWDTAGQERFRSLIPSYIRDCQAAIVCYDISSEKSFQNLTRWAEDVREERGNEVSLFLLANKIDLEDRREVQTEQGEEKAKELEAKFSEVSAKTGKNVQEFFYSLSLCLQGEGPQESNLAQTSKSQNKEQPNQQGNKVQLGQQQEVAKEKSSCC